MNVILITGTSTGIGMTTALHLARRGHRIYASMCNLGRGSALREAAASERLPIELIELDVDNANSVSRAIENVLGREDRIDVLINNAGIAPFGAIERATEADVNRVFETNFSGPCARSGRCCRRCGNGEAG